MSLCAGCQIFKGNIFCVKNNPSRENSGRHEIHKSYAELSTCADNVCQLCSFFRRQCWYDFQLWKENSSHVGTDTIEQSVVLYFSYASRSADDTTFGATASVGAWNIGLGSKSSCFNGFITEFPDVSSRKTLEFEEIREANPPLQQSLDRCRDWLSTCRDHHKRCWPSTIDYPKFLPTRLLDVGVQSQQTVRLVLSKEIIGAAKAAYVTLSYCWGATNDAARTTKENLVDRLESIQVDTLPKSLQDAITVTRGLGIRYLWIDALCIIQGDSSENEDWLRELPNMGKIYGQSLLTIAASSASSSDQGFLRRKNVSYRPIRNYHLVDNSNSNGPEVIVLAPSLPGWEMVDDASPLSKRGWVLQESMLSSRTVFWTDEGIFWQCGERNTSEYEEFLSAEVGLDIFPTRFHDVCEELEQYMDLAKQSKHTVAGPGSIAGAVPGPGSQWDKTALSKWYRIIEDLSRRSLTVGSDRLPALTGLGKEIARIAGAEFKDGTFRPMPLRELAWFSTSYRRTRRIPGISTWSWASTDQEVYFDDAENDEWTWLAQGVNLDGQHLHICSRLGVLPVTKCVDEFRTLEEDDFITLGNLPVTTRVGNFGMLKNIDSRPVENFERVEDFRMPEENLYGSPKQLVKFDTKEDAERITYDTQRHSIYGKVKVGHVRCVQWMSSPRDWEARKLRVLLVFAVDEAQQTYRRIGWAEVIDNGYFEEELTDITLV